MSKALLKSVSKLFIAEMGKRGVTLKPTLSYQLISAAFGFWSHESLTGFELPIEEVNPRVYFCAKPQFHTELLRERIETLLEVDSKRSFDLAMLIQDLLTHHIPIRVQTLRVMFDDQYAQRRALIFKILKPKNSHHPTLATVAIANGYLPPLPASSLGESLNLMRSKTIGGGKGKLTIDTFVRRARTWIWCYPSAMIAETAHSLADSAFHVATEADDWVVSDRTHETEVGVGFVLIQSQDGGIEEAKCFTIVSGNFMLEANGTAVEWSDVKVHARDLQERRTFRQKAIAEVLGHEVEMLPLLTICPTCGQFQANAPESEAIIHCNCRAH